MVLLFLSNAVLDVVRLILDLLPDWDIDIFQVPTLFTEIINLLYYILPMDTLKTLFGLTIMITSFRIILAIVNKVFSVLEVL